MVKLTHESKIIGTVRYIDEDDNDTIVDIMAVKKIASDAGLDVVIVSEGETPVVKIIDYGKFQYQKQKQQKQQKQKSGSLKEVKFHVNTSKNDYNVKLNHILKFLGKSHKVKISIQFRGREMAHKELGREVLEKIIFDTAQVSKVESNLHFMGKQCFVMLLPKASK